jgi:hypothetical protein
MEGERETRGAVESQAFSYVYTDPLQLVMTFRIGMHAHRLSPSQILAVPFNPSANETSLILRILWALVICLSEESFLSDSLIILEGACSVYHLEVSRRRGQTILYSFSLTS